MTQFLLKKYNNTSVPSSSSPWLHWTHHPQDYLGYKKTPSDLWLDLMDAYGTQVNRLHTHSVPCPLEDIGALELPRAPLMTSYPPSRDWKSELWPDIQSWGFCSQLLETFWSNKQRSIDRELYSRVAPKQVPVRVEDSQQSQFRRADGSWKM